MCYRPQTKLRERNVFTGVCLSFIQGEVVGPPMMYWDMGTYPLLPKPHPHMLYPLPHIPYHHLHIPPTPTDTDI